MPPLPLVEPLPVRPAGRPSRGTFWPSPCLSFPWPPAPTLLLAEEKGQGPGGLESSAPGP